MDHGSDSGPGSDGPTDSVELVCWKVWGGNGHVELPVAIPGLRGQLYSRPCEGEQGGDVYYLSACGSGALARLCIADVTGHGTSVATFSGWLEEVFSRHIHRASPSRVLHEVNRRAVTRGLEVMSTAVCLSYNSLNGRLAFCNAGHPPIRLCRAGESTWEPIQVHDSDSKALANMPLAVDKGTRYTVGRCQLQPGDRLLIHTDGLTEMQNDRREFLGDCLWQEGMVPGSDGPVDDIMGAIREAASNHGTPACRDADDVTVMVLEAQPYQQSNRYSLLIRNNFNRLFKTLKSA